MIVTFAFSLAVPHWVGFRDGYQRADIYDNDQVLRGPARQEGQEGDGQEGGQGGGGEGGGAQGEDREEGQEGRQEEVGSRETPAWRRGMAGGRWAMTSAQGEQKD